MTLPLREILHRMRMNAEALRRLQLAAEVDPLDLDHLAHLHELLDDIAARELRNTNALNEMYLRDHLERRVWPHPRRSGLGDRRHG